MRLLWRSGGLDVVPIRRLKLDIESSLGLETVAAFACASEGR